MDTYVASYLYFSNECRYTMTVEKGTVIGKCPAFKTMFGPRLPWINAFIFTIFSTGCPLSGEGPYYFFPQLQLLEDTFLYMLNKYSCLCHVLQCDNKTTGI